MVASFETDWLKDIAELSIQHALDYGASFAEARLEVKKSNVLVFNNGMLLTADSSKSMGLGLRAIANGGLAFYAISANSPRKQIEKAIERVVKTAMIASDCRKSPVVLTDESSHVANWKTEVREPLENIPAETKISWLHSMDKDLVESCGEEHIDSRVFLYQDATKSGYFENSDGTRISSDLSQLNIYMLITAKGAKSSEQSWGQLGGSGGWELRHELKISEYFIDRARELCKVAETATTIKSGTKVDMVVGGEVAGIIAHENAGHPSEADRIWGREAAQAGGSYLTQRNIGDRLGSEFVTIVDDPTIPQSMGFYLYDAEGVKARPKILIKNGIYEQMMHNRETAAIYGLEHSNAAARAQDWNREPIVRMSNTHFAPGDFSFEELVEDVRDGLYMSSFQEWNIDDRRWQSKYVGSVVYRIRDGELSNELIRRPVLEITSPGLFGAVDGCSKDLEFVGALCGKSDPSQGVPVWMGGPNVRLRGIRLG